MLKTVLKKLSFAVVLLAPLCLSGCLAAAAVAGASGGYYLDKNYKVQVSKKTPDNANHQNSNGSGQQAPAITRNTGAITLN